MEKKSAHAAEQDRPDILKQRWAWFEAQPDLDPDWLVFIDGSKHCFERGFDQHGSHPWLGTPSFTASTNRRSRISIRTAKMPLGGAGALWPPDTA